jgi:hypothetical protein
MAGGMQRFKHRLQVVLDADGADTKNVSSLDFHLPVTAVFSDTKHNDHCVFR